jgi:hypothetical protein
MRIRDIGWKNIRIQDKHSGSATLADADMARSQGKSNVWIFWYRNFNRFTSMVLQRPCTYFEFCNILNFRKNFILRSATLPLIFEGKKINYWLDI